MKKRTFRISYPLGPGWHHSLYTILCIYCTCSCLLYDGSKWFEADMKKTDTQGRWDQLTSGENPGQVSSLSQRHSTIWNEFAHLWYNASRITKSPTEITFSPVAHNPHAHFRTGAVPSRSKLGVSGRYCPSLHIKNQNLFLLFSYCQQQTG